MIRVDLWSGKKAKAMLVYLESCVCSPEKTVNLNMLTFIDSVLAGIYFLKSGDNT
jgi:hypothetical protein